MASCAATPSTTSQQKVLAGTGEPLKGDDFLKMSGASFSVKVSSATHVGSNKANARQEVSGLVNEVHLVLAHGEKVPWQQKWLR